MAVLGNRVSMVDMAKRVDKDGTFVKIAEVLEQSNPILEDMPFYESNAPLSNRVSFRTGLPEIGFARLTKGIAPSKSNVTSREDTIGWLEGRSEVDRRHAGRSMTHDNYLKFRWSEDRAFLQAMGHRQAQLLLFGDERYESEAYTGFFPRLSDVTDPIFGESVTVAAEKSSGGEKGFDNILIVDWGEDYCHGIYPFNTPAGLKKTDHPNEPVKDKDGGTFYADVSQFEWAMGLTVRHPKHVHRIANIPRSNFEALYGTSATIAGNATNLDDLPDLVSYLVHALGEMDECTNGHRVIYTSKRIMGALSLMARNHNNVHLSIGEWAGKRVTEFWGIPIRKLDVLDKVIDEGINAPQTGT